MMKYIIEDCANFYDSSNELIGKICPGYNTLRISTKTIKRYDYPLAYNARFNFN